MRSCPKTALIDPFLRVLAISGSWGPHSCLKLWTAFSCLISRAITGPVVRWSTSPLYSGSTPLKVRYFGVEGWVVVYSGLWMTYLIDVQEFLGDGSVQLEHVQGPDFESLL